MIARKRPPRTPLEHIKRAQELIEQVENGSPAPGGDTYLRVQLAHLHLRAAEVSAKLPREVRSVADSINATTLSAPPVGGGMGHLPGLPPAAAAEAMRFETRRRQR